ncbi:MAG: hypothetical protein JSW65_02505 [Candidatus Bipolaricaulota bacterium]|nr:MAG: hypothetical protein JSW65_02505 [Candidatus Bipolaricaulota bacterium]
MKVITKLVPAVLALCLCVGIGAAASSLEASLRLIPAETEELMLLFTDWDRIRAALALDDVTSASPFEERLELAMSTSQTHAAGSAFALHHLVDHAANWGWDTTDLAWEAYVITGRLPPFYLLRLRDHVSFDTIATHFVEKGFVQTESHGVTVFHHDIVPGEDWLRTTEISILNTAYLPGERLLVLSSFPGGVEVVIRTLEGELASLQGDPYAVAAVTHLGEPFAAILLAGLGECLRFPPNPVLDPLGTLPSQGTADAIRAAVEESDLLVPYRVFAVGYREVDGIPVGSIVFEYDAVELAELDLAPRRLLAEEGRSSSFDAPIAESYFSVLSAGVEDRAIVFAVAPVNDQPMRLFRMVHYRDAPFAGCSVPRD